MEKRLVLGLMVFIGLGTVATFGATNTTVFFQNVVDPNINIVAEFFCPESYYSDFGQAVFSLVGTGQVTSGEIHASSWRTWPIVDYGTPTWGSAEVWGGFSGATGDFETTFSQFAANNWTNAPGPPPPDPNTWHCKVGSVHYVSVTGATGFHAEGHAEAYDGGYGGEDDLRPSWACQYFDGDVGSATVEAHRFFGDLITVADFQAEATGGGILTGATMTKGVSLLVWDPVAYTNWRYGYEGLSYNVRFEGQGDLTTWLWTDGAFTEQWQDAFGVWGRTFNRAPDDTSSEMPLP